MGFHKSVEYGLHLLVALKLGICIHAGYAVFMATFKQILEDQETGSLTLLLWEYAYHQRVDGIVLAQCLQDMDETEREEAPPGFPECL